MTQVLRPRSLLWLTATAGCLLTSGPDEASRGGGSSQASPTELGPERALGPRRARAALWPQVRGEPFRPASPEQRDATRRLLAAVTRHARGEADESTIVGASAAGLTVERWTIGGHPYLAVLEDRGHRGTTGSVLVRVGPPSTDTERVLQAPHAFFDVGTGELALDVFLAHPTELRALLTNTMHRHTKEDGKRRKGEDDPADVCHNDDHPFVAATMGVVEGLGDAEVIQLHGFGDDHELPGMPGAWAVVSTGTATEGVPRVTAVARALQTSFEGPIARFPDDVGELGATTNVIGRRLRDRPGARFLHVELSSSFRRRLREDAQGPARLGAALLADSPSQELAPTP